MPRRPVSRNRPSEPTSRACPVGTDFGRAPCRSATPQCGAPGSHVRAAVGSATLPILGRGAGAHEGEGSNLPGGPVSPTALVAARPRAVQGVVRALLPGQRLALDALRHLRRAGTEAVALV